MEPSLPKETTASLILKIEQTYAELVWLYQSIPGTELAIPALPNEWSIKDLVAHIAAWEWRCAMLLDASHASNAPLLAQPDVDALNKEIQLERSAWSWEEVEFDARKAHESLIEAIHHMQADRLTDPIVYDTIAQETWEHYSEHLADLRHWHTLHASVSSVN